MEQHLRASELHTDFLFFVFCSIHKHQADDTDDTGSATTTASLSVNPAVSRQRDYIYIYIADNLAKLYRMRG